jgi:hypothetical protein
MNRRGDARSERGVDPFPEVGGRPFPVGAVAGRGQKALHAFPDEFGRQAADVVLEGIGHPGLGHADPGLALVVQDVAAQKVREHPVEVFEM